MLLSLLPQPPGFAPLSCSWCAQPLCPGLERSCTSSGCRQDPSPWGGLCWQEFVLGGPSQQEVEGPPPKAGALPGTEERSLPLGDVCIPFLTPPDKALPLGGSHYSPDSSPTLFRMGARGTPSPGPPLHVPQLPLSLGLLLALCSGAALCFKYLMGYPKSSCREA